METALATVETVLIGDEQVDVVFDNHGKGWAVVKRMCDVLGIDAPSQWQKLNDSKWATVGLIPTVGNDGKQREMFCLSIESVPMWLATMQANRCAEAVRPKLERFQKEAANVLFQWVQGKLKTNTPMPTVEMMLTTEFVTKALLALQEAQTVNKALATKIAFDEHKVDFYKQVTAADDDLSVRDTAAIYNIKGLGQNILYEFLRAIRVCDSRNRPYVCHINLGHVRSIEEYNVVDGITYLHVTLRVTPKGQDYIFRQLHKTGVVVDNKLQREALRNLPQNIAKGIYHV